MDNRNNKRYKKLNVKRKKTLNKTIGKDTKSINEIKSDEEHFKIKRFMKDVRKFCGQSPVEEPGNKPGDDAFIDYNNITKQKDNKTNENGNRYKLKKESFRNKNYTRRDGLFQRGVIGTKGFNKGLMPPSLNARINEDLQKMIELASRGNSKNMCDEKQDEDKSMPLKNLNNEQFFNLDKSSGCDRVVNSPSVSIVEAEVQVDSPDVNTSDRKKSDLYLQFTHFVTRSLYNSGIDKLEIKSHTNSIKESLIKTYHSKPENNLREVLTNDSPSDSNKSLTNNTLKTPYKARTPYMSCPSTSKSDEGPVQTKFTFTSDSQFSDDIVIRKPLKKMYASGLDYLKSVYSDSSENDKSYLPNSPLKSSFSPIQKNLTYNSSKLYNMGTNYSSDNLLSLDNSAYKCSQTQWSLLSANEDNKENMYSDFNQDPSRSLQYFLGNQNKKPHPWKNLTCTSHNAHTSLESDASKEEITEKSPKYISLLPPRRRFYISNELNVQSVSGKVNCLEYDNRRSIDHSLLSLPVRPPPRKSPEIQYKPRKMF